MKKQREIFFALTITLTLLVLALPVIVMAEQHPARLVKVSCTVAEAAVKNKEVLQQQIESGVSLLLPAGNFTVSPFTVVGVTDPTLLGGVANFTLQGTKDQTSGAVQTLLSFPAAPGLTFQKTQGITIKDLRAEGPAAANLLQVTDNGTVELTNFSSTVASGQLYTDCLAPDPGHCIADIQGDDGDVDGEDHQYLISELGRSTTNCTPAQPCCSAAFPCKGDLTKDGKVDAADQAIMMTELARFTAKGNCSSDDVASNRSVLYFPSIMDNDAMGWENNLSVQAKDPVLMDVKIRVFNLAGKQMGQFIYSDTDPAANAPAIKPNARVAQRPSQIVGSATSPIAVEGSVVVETNVPAIGSTNSIANNYNGFAIYEAAKPRQIHNFPKAFDGPDAPYYQVYLLVQNIYDLPINATVKLFGKTPADPGHGATKTYTIPKYGTLKVRPIEVAPLDAYGKQISFGGSVVVYSDLATPGDGKGLPIPAMCRFEAGTYALAIYESTVAQPSLQFPNMKDGKFGGALDYQNFLSVVNMSLTDAAVINVYAYDKSGNLKASTLNVSIPPSGKKTWRPSQIPPGSIAVPNDFEGSVVVTTSIPVVGQTNTIYPGTNAYGADGFDLFESAMLRKSLFFPKAYDGLPGGGTIGSTKLTDNFVYVQNSEATTKNIKIEQFNNNGTINGSEIVALPAYATYSWLPRNFATDGSGVFRGSIKVTEQAGLMIAGAIKYELHNTTSPASKIDNMCFYRSMGQ